MFSILMSYTYMNKILLGGFMDFLMTITSLGLLSIPIYLFVAAAFDLDVNTFGNYVLGVMGLATIVTILQKLTKK